MKIKKVLLVFILGVFVLFGIMYAMGKYPENNKNSIDANSGKEFTFSLKKLGGKEYISSADFAGQPLFVDFWASWCPPCRQSTPYVEKLHNKFKDKVHVVGINLDHNTSSAQDFIKKSSIGYLQLEGTGSDVPAKYGVSGIPAFFIIDGNGKIVKKYVGFGSGYYDEWVQIISDLVE